MSKPQFRSSAFFRNFENDVGSCPFLLPVHKRQVAIGHMPHNLFCGNELGNPLPGIMCVPIAIIELRSESIGLAFERTRPPAACVVYCAEDPLRRLID